MIGTKSKNLINTQALEKKKKKRKGKETSRQTQPGRRQKQWHLFFSQPTVQHSTALCCTFCILAPTISPFNSYIYLLHPQGIKILKYEKNNTNIKKMSIRL